MNFPKTAKSEIRQKSYPNEEKIHELVLADKELRSQIQSLTAFVDSNSNNINIITVRFR